MERKIKKDKRATFNMRLPIEVWARLKVRADSNMRSMNLEVKKMICDSMEADNG